MVHVQSQFGEPCDEANWLGKKEATGHTRKPNFDVPGTWTRGATADCRVHSRFKKKKEIGRQALWDDNWQYRFLKFLLWPEACFPICELWDFRMVIRDQCQCSIAAQPFPLPHHCPPAIVITCSPRHDRQPQGSRRLLLYH